MSEITHSLQHPDTAMEQAHLAETLDIVREERQKAEHALGIVDGNDRFIQVIDDGTDEAIAAQFLTRTKLRQLHQLRLSEKRPYFARLDFMRAGMSAAEKIYLGRWGVYRTPGYQVCVADWRSPVANLYYSGQIGPVSYEAPDGAIHGELSLKRMFTIGDAGLEDIADVGLLGQEKFLTDALSQVTGNRLREIVTTIQAEQNVVIRHEPDTPLIVQGVAGSGKTTIALHRIAWLLYRLQKTLAPHQLMILAPNPLFLDYISRVLPDLGVNEVRQTTFPLLCGVLLGKRMPKLTASARLEERLSMDKPARDALDAVLRRKGALALRAELARYLSELEPRAYPERDVVFAGRTLLTAGDVRDLFMRQFRHFPLETRMKELRKVVSARLKRVVDETREALLAAVDERLDRLLATLPDGDERRARATTLLNSRDERMKQLDAAQKAFLKQYDDTWRSFDLLTVYGEFWDDLAARDPDYALTRDATRPLLAKKQAAPEDLPALLALADGLYGLKRMDIKHVVIDEAQDMSPLTVRLLRERFGHDAFTLVGDLWQGVYGDEGMRSWEDIGAGVFGQPPEKAELSVSYRSTVEIVEKAFSILSRRPLPGLRMARPVLRHGEPPTLTRAKSEDDRAQQIARQVRDWLAEGYYSVAVIVKRESDAKRLHKRISALLPESRLVSRGDAAFEGGVMVMGASVVKGLEFDCVIIADADAKTYPDEPFYAKLLYVLCTRPLHRLRFISVGEPCAYL